MPRSSRRRNNKYRSALLIETTNSLIDDDENVLDEEVDKGIHDSFNGWCCGAGGSPTSDFDSSGPLSFPLFSVPLFSVLLEQISAINMGGASSAPLTQEQEDLKWLGERFAFGDAELKHIYQAYHRLLHKKSRHTTFLHDWIMECSGTALSLERSTRTVNNSLVAQQQFVLSLDERRTLIQRVEQEILGGAHVSNALFRVACTTPEDTIWYHPSSSSSSSTSVETNTSFDEFTRKARLERLFEGLSNMGRRGAKHALTTMFDTVKALEQQQPPSQSSSQSEAAGGIPAKALMNFGYRLSLAASFLQAVQTMEQQIQQQENDNNSAAVVDVMARATQLFQQYIPSENCHTGLEPMAQSLLEKCTSRRNRYGAAPAADADTDAPVRVELDDVLEWSESVAPLFATIVPTLLFHVLFWGRPHPPTKTLFEFPNHRPDETTTSNDTQEEDTENKDDGNDKASPPPPSRIEPSILDSSPLLFALACTSPALMGPYFRLYTSAADGLSFNRILNALLGYSGPTLLLIQSTTGGVFGAFTSHAWKESKDFYGNSDCFLFQLLDSLAVYRPRGQDKNYMYCNSTARSKGYDQQAHGIGFGGTVHQPRLFIAENLMEDCEAASQDLTFENGSLLPKNQRHPGTGAPGKSFDIESMEIWGVGGSDIVLQALDQRRKAREMRDEGIRRARKVDKAQFLDDFRSGAIDSKAFAFKQQIDGRADQDVKERQGGAYEYEK